jgi:hypothetical protein
MEYKIEFTDKEITQGRYTLTETISLAIKRRKWITRLRMNTNDMNSPPSFEF